MDSKPVIIAAEGEGWPSGRPRSVGFLLITPEELARRIGAPLASGVEEGLGPWRGCGLRLPSGRGVELIRYDWSGAAAAEFDLRADYEDDPGAARAEALAMLGLPASAVAWAPAE